MAVTTGIESRRTQAKNEHRYQQLQQAILNDPHTEENYFNLAEFFFENREYVSAVHFFNEYINRTKQYGRPEVRSIAYDHLGQCYENQLNTNAAKQCYYSATRINPHAAHPWFHLGLLHFNSASQTSNELSPLQIQSSHPNQIMICIILSMNQDQSFFHLDFYMYFLTKIFQNAVSKNTDELLCIDNTFKSAIQYFYQANACQHESHGLKNKIRSNQIECIAQYGHYLYKKCDFYNAQKYYLQVLKFDPDHIPVLNQMGMCMYKLQNYAEARSYFEQIIQRTTYIQEQADAWFNLSWIFIAQKNWTKAANALREAKLRSPKDPLIQPTEKEISLGMVASSSKKHALFTSNPSFIDNQASMELEHRAVSQL